MTGRLFYANLKLGTHQKFESKNSLSALAILYPLLLQWHKTLRKILNWIIPFCLLLEVSIVKGNILSFTDDKAKGYKINKRLGSIAATATAGYRKITGRAKEQLEKNVKKIYLFEGQLRSWQSDITNNHDRKLQLAVG